MTLLHLDELTLLMVGISLGILVLGLTLGIVLSLRSLLTKIERIECLFGLDEQEDQPSKKRAY